MKAPSLGDLKTSIQVLRRRTVPPGIYSAEVDHEYVPAVTTRAAVKTRGGTSEFNRVVIEGQPASHTFTIRYTTIQIDVQDRITDARGWLYTILAVENIDEGNVWMNLHCAKVGSLDRESVN